MQSWKHSHENCVSIFEKYLDYTKNKTIFTWQQIPATALKNVTLIHCSQLYEYNCNTGSLEYSYYILTSKFLIKLKVYSLPE